MNTSKIKAEDVQIGDVLVGWGAVIEKSLRSDIYGTVVSLRFHRDNVDVPPAGFRGGELVVIEAR